MHSLSRRTFVATSGAFAAAGLAGPLAARPASARPMPAVTPATGIFSVFLSSGRALLVIRSAGRAPIPVVFDTGTNGNAIDSGIARVLRLKKVPNHITAVVDGATGSRFEAHDFILPDLSIDGLRIGDRVVTAYSYDKPAELGIFGPSLFSGQLVYLDLGNAFVRVIDKAAFALEPGDAIAYLGAKGDGLPALPIQLPAKAGQTASLPVMAKLDSGNNRALNLPEAYLDSVPLKRPAMIVGRSTSVSGVREVMGGQIDGTVTIGTVNLTDPEVVFDGRTPNIGLPVIRQLRLVLDPEAEQAWLVGPRTLPTEKLLEYAGRFGARRVSLVAGQLVYQRDGGPPRRLIPLGADLFDLAGSREQIQFERAGGVVTRMVLITATNQMVPIERDRT